jgi:aminoacrylate hydrolase
MPKANIGDAEIHYESHGSGDPLLLVSGLGGVAAYWKPNLPALAAKYRVIVHDHRGIGQSSRSLIKYSVDQMTHDVLRLMDQLKIERAHLVGHSTGGAIGQTLAIKEPQRLKSMVLFSTWTKSDAFFRRIFEARKTLLLRGGPEAYSRAASFFLYPDWWVNAHESLLEERERAGLAAFPPVEIVASRIDAIVAFDRSAELARISTPTLVLVAKDDFLTPPYFSQELAKRIPGAKLQILEKGGHCSSETALAEFNRAVLDFVATIRP